MGDAYLREAYRPDVSTRAACDRPPRVTRSDVAQCTSAGTRTRVFANDRADDRARPWTLFTNQLTCHRRRRFVRNVPQMLRRCCHESSCAARKNARLLAPATLKLVSFLFRSQRSIGDDPASVAISLQKAAGVPGGKTIGLDTEARVD